MSIKIMSRVWSQSQHRGSLLLLLLGLADHAADDGVCYPGVSYLARKIRMTRRHTQRLLEQLEVSGEVYIDRRSGRGHTNQYFIVLGFDEKEIIATLIKRYELFQDEAVKRAQQIIAKRDGKGDLEDTLFAPKEKVTPKDEKVTPKDEKVTPKDEKGDMAMSPEPSRTVIEPLINLKPKPDLFDLARKTEVAQRHEGNWSVPFEAGGDNVFADGPTDAFAEILAGITPLFLPDETRKQWGDKLRQIAEHWSTDKKVITAELMEDAIRRIPSSGLGWKTYTSPYTSSFETDIGTLLLGSGPQIQKGTSHGSHQPLSARDDPNYRIAPPPEESKQTAAVVRAVKARDAQLRSESD